MPTFYTGPAGARERGRYTHFLPAFRAGNMVFIRGGRWLVARRSRCRCKRGAGRTRSAEIDDGGLGASGGGEFFEVLNPGIPIALPPLTQALFRIVKGAVEICLLFQQVRHDPVAKMFALYVAWRNALHDLIGIAYMQFATFFCKIAGRRKMDPQIVGIPDYFLNEQMQSIPIPRFDEKLSADEF